VPQIYTDDGLLVHSFQSLLADLADLQRCLMEWETQRRIDPFPLGAHDSSDRLTIPERLCGREREIGSLRASFERVVAGGTSHDAFRIGHSLSFGNSWRIRWA
jgi:hypothetical protein